MNETPPGHVDTPLRVRYAETDQMGVAYYANYLVWFEVGRAGYCRAHGFSYSDLERRYAAFLPVVEANCRYRRPLVYDDEFLVRTWIQELKTRSIIFAYQILDSPNGSWLAEGRTRHIVTNLERRPCRLPEEFFRFLAASQTRLPEGSRGDGVH